MKKLEVRSKVWLEVDGEPLLGEGRERLLLLIEQEGSISAAARAMDIPYRKAWSYLENMEKKLGFALVERHKGGARGGRTTLTAKARSLLARFDELKKGVQEFVDGRFVEAFGKAAGEQK
ncbi:MAG TPA: LysR family transcriptional regulator [Desulfuromonadales bacterium]